jgi:hypothetical protein
MARADARLGIQDQNQYFSISFITKNKSIFTMHFLKSKTLATVFAFVGIMLFSLPSMAQRQKYNDEELKKFAKVLVDVITIQQQSQMQMIAVIEENEMSIQRFNQMMMESQEKPIEQVEGTQEEKEAFANISVEIMGIQEQMEDQLIKSIEDEGLSIERYEEILTDYQADPELQQRIRQLAE